MKKLLIDSDILLKTFQQDPAASRLLDICRQEAKVQGWILANSVEKLVRAELSNNQIGSLLEGITQIPVNALLNQQALEKGIEFEAAQLEVAAAIFKLDLVVSDRYAISGAGKIFLNPDQALSAITSEETPQTVAFMNLNLGLHPIYDKVDGWFTEIIQNTAFAGGNHVDAFEKEFAQFCGTDYAIGLSNGTDALRFALLAMGIGPGDEVITVPNTFIATTEVISQVGAEPVFVDVNADTYTLDPDLLVTKITSRTKAIVPVHLYGQVADMERILEIAAQHGLEVLEDACQAHGAEYNGKRAGSFGRAAAFSMYPGKNLGAFGEAGCVITNDKKIEETIKCLRDHGQAQKYHHRMEGFNGRMDNLQAAALRGKLPLLDEWNQQRRELAKLYLTHLKDVSQLVLPAVPDFSAHVFHLFVILAPDSKALSNYLKEKGVHTAFHYPVPLHLQDAYQEREQAKGSFPVSEDCAKRLISLPMYPELTEQEILKVCQAIRQFFSA